MSLTKKLIYAPSHHLFETDFPLKRIAELTGFEHVEYMCVVYKRLIGEASGAYRRRHAVAKSP